MPAHQPTFDTFRPTAGAARAMDLARALAMDAEGAPSLLFLTGPAGVGKTHILRAALSHRARLCPGAHVVRVAAPEVVERLVAAAQHGRIELASVGWESAELLALDDLNTLAGLPVTQREVARLLRLAARSGTRLLCAAGGSLGPLEPLLASLRDEPGFVLARLEAADHRESRRILVELAQQAGLRPSRRLQAAVATSAHGDVRRALGALRSYLFELDVAGCPVARRPAQGQISCAAARRRAPTSAEGIRSGSQDPPARRP